MSRCILTGQERSQNNKKTKNMVRGRYLATFSSNPFAISEKLVAALVAAGVLVATFGLTSYWQLAIGRPKINLYHLLLRCYNPHKQRGKTGDRKTERKSCSPQIDADER